MTGIVLITAAKGQSQTTAQAVKGVSGITEVYLVTGRYDIVAVVEAADFAGLVDVVANRLQAVGGVISTETLVGHRA